jgi:hypothetical protein
VRRREYSKRWSLPFETLGRYVRRATPAEPVPIENHCAKVGEFFAGNQFVNGKNGALVIFLPLHPLENGGYAYCNQARRVEGDDPSTWGNLEIVGDRWVYSSDEVDKGKKIYWRTINVFSGTDKIHFEVQRSEDGGLFWLYDAPGRQVHGSPRRWLALSFLWLKSCISGARRAQH